MNTNSVQFFHNHQVPQVPPDCQLTLAAWKPRSPANMGHIIRLGHNTGAGRVLFINDNPDYRLPKIKKTAGFSYEQTDWQIIDRETFFSLMNETAHLVVLETCEGAKNIFHQQLPGKMILLAGNESHGLPQELIRKSRITVFIPVPGGCKSMNIAQALAVGSFEWYRQHSRV